VGVLGILELALAVVKLVLENVRRAVLCLVARALVADLAPVGCRE
jgi:hypothetical protein